MKTIILLSSIILTSLNVIAGSPKEVVVFSKDLADGKTLKVFRSSVLLPPSSGSANETKTNWFDDYSIIIQDGTNQTEVPYGGMAKWREAGALDNIKFIDVEYKGRSGVFLYTCGNGASDEQLYVTLTGNPPVVAIDPRWSKIDLRGSGLPAKMPPPSDGTANERQLWLPDHSVYSEFKNARIIGSQSESNLSIEVDSTLGTNNFTSTNKFVGGKWVVSKSQPVPLEK